MFNRIVVLLLLISEITVFAQNEKLQFYKVVDNGSIHFYLNSVGSITTESKAKYYRKTSIDMNTFNYDGITKDYTIDDRLVYQCFYNDGICSGQVISYFDNGNIRYKGIKINSFKDSVWNYYYSNGQKEKVIIYKNDTAFLKEYYKKNEKPLVLEGNGKFKGTIIPGYQQTIEYNISGSIKNGKLDGKWILTGKNTFALEQFENGRFIKGSSYGYIYDKNPKISLLGFDWHENVDIFKFIAVPHSNNNAYLFSQMLKFKGNNDLNKTFITELKDKITKTITANNILNFWGLVQFVVSAENKINDINIFTNNSIIKEELTQFIQGLNYFESAKPDNQPVDCSIYLSILCENGTFICPEYQFNSSFGLMNLIPNQ